MHPSPQYDRFDKAVVLLTAALLFVFGSIAVVTGDALRRSSFRANDPTVAVLTRPLGLSAPALLPAGSPRRHPDLLPPQFDGRFAPQVPFVWPPAADLLLGPSPCCRHTEARHAK